MSLTMLKTLRMHFYFKISPKCFENKREDKEASFIINSKAFVSFLKVSTQKITQFPRVLNFKASQPQPWSEVSSGPSAFARCCECRLSCYRELMAGGQGGQPPLLCSAERSHRTDVPPPCTAASEMHANRYPYPRYFVTLSLLH